jgi:hypothetical protein
MEGEFTHISAYAGHSLRRKWRSCRIRKFSAEMTNRSAMTERQQLFDSTPDLR